MTYPDKEKPMSRFGHIPFTHESNNRAQVLLTLFEELEARIDELAGSRSKSVALTKLEEAHMWANKAIRDHQLEVEGPTE